MSGDLRARAAVLEALQGDAVLGGLVNQIADGDPIKASAPWVSVSDAGSAAFGARGVDGLAVRVTIALTARGGEAAGVAPILERIDTVLRGLPDTIGDWRLTVLRLERSRLSRVRGDWRLGADYALRLVRLV